MSENIKLDVNQLANFQSQLATILSGIDEIQADIMSICASNYYQSGKAMEVFNMYREILGKIPAISAYYYKLYQYMEVTRYSIEQADESLAEKIRGKEK